MLTKTLFIIFGTFLFEIAAQNRNEDPTMIPYLVSLRYLNNTHFCNGALIDEKWILTTKECINGMDQKDVIAVVGLSEFKNAPQYLPTDKNNEDIENEIMEEIHEKMHQPLQEKQILKCVDFVTSPDLNGLAMIELSTAVNPSLVFPIALNLNKSQEFLQDSVMIGWPMVSNDIQPKAPDFYSYRLANNDFCKDSFFNELLEMCLIPNENIQNIGHQGSPIIVNNKLVGIMSESSKSTVAFKVAEYNQWIKNTISGQGYVEWLFALLFAMVMGA